MLPGKTYTPEEIVRLLLKHKWLMLVPFLVGLTAATLVSRGLPERYRSQTLIMVVPQRISQELVPQTVHDTIEGRLMSISDQIQSRSRLEGIITDFDLYRVQRAQGMIMEDVVQLMRSDIDVKLDGNGKESFRVTYESDEPMTAFKVTEQLANLYIQENQKDKENLNESTGLFLESELEDAKRRLLEQEKKLETYRKQYAGQLPSQLDSNQQTIHSARLQLQTIGDSINRARERRLVVQRQLGDAQSVVPPVSTSPSEVNSQGDSAGLSAAQQLEAAEGRLSAFKLRYKPDHPDIRSLERAIRDLQAKVAVEAQQPQARVEKSLSPAEVARQRRIRDLEAELQVIDRQIGNAELEEGRLKGTISTLEARISVVPTRESELIELTRDYETLKTSYSSLLRKQEDAKLSANLQRRQIGETFKVIDAAAVPQRPFNRWRRLQVIGGGAAAGLVLGLTLIGLLEYRDSSFKSEEDVMRVLSLPVLATVPMMASERERTVSRRRRLVVSVVAVVVLVGSAAVVMVWGLQS